MLISKRISPEMSNHFRKEFGVQLSPKLLVELKTTTVKKVVLGEDRTFFTDDRSDVIRSKYNGIISMILTLANGDEVRIQLVHTPKSEWTKFIHLHKRWVDGLEEDIMDVLEGIEFIPAIHVISKRLGWRKELAGSIALILRRKVLGLKEVFRWNTSKSGKEGLTEKNIEEVMKMISSNINQLKAI